MKEFVTICNDLGMDTLVKNDAGFVLFLGKMPSKYVQMRKVYEFLSIIRSKWL